MTAFWPVRAFSPRNVGHTHTCSLTLTSATHTQKDIKLSKCHLPNMLMLSAPVLVLLPAVKSLSGGWLGHRGWQHSASSLVLNHSWWQRGYDPWVTPRWKVTYNASWSEEEMDIKWASPIYPNLSSKDRLCRCSLEVSVKMSREQVCQC